MSQASDHDLLVQMGATQKAMSKQIGKIFSSLEGNGQPGLKQEMAKLKAEHAQCMAERSLEPQKQGNWVNFAMLIVVIIFSLLSYTS